MKPWDVLKPLQPKLSIALALKPSLAAPLLEVIATMARATEHLQIIVLTPSGYRRRISYQISLSFRQKMPLEGKTTVSRPSPCVFKYLLKS
jgi:hypothetical protein